jgi:uncharacterized protein (TIGR03437 family)
MVGAWQRALPLLPSSSFGSVWAVIPHDAPLGEAVVTLIQNRERTATTISVRATAPGVFGMGGPSGPALALNYGGAQPVRNGLTTAAVPDGYVALFATGLNGAAAQDVSVVIAGQAVPAVFAGPQGSPGLDQVNFVVPRDVYMGCYVPVALRVRGVVSNAVTLSINRDPYACAHPLGLTYSELRTLDAGGRISLAELSISGSLNKGIWMESAGLPIFEADSAVVALTAGPQMPDAEYFGCRPASFGLAGSVRVLRPFPFGTPPMILTGPGGERLELTRLFTSLTSPTQTTPFFRAGPWQLSYAGSAELFPILQSFRLPPVAISTSLIRIGQDIEVRWNPAGFGPGDVVTVQGAETCRVRASEGRVVLSAAAGVLMIATQPHPAARTQFRLLRKDGSTVPTVVSSFYIDTFESVVN